MKKRIFKVISLLLAFIFLCGCAKQMRPQNTNAGTPAASTAAENTPGTTGTPENTPDISKLISAPNFNVANISYTRSVLSANVPDYKINGDLSNVVNLKDFDLTDAQKAALAKNGFFVGAETESQMCYIYERNLYDYTPDFVTTDSVLQVYHIYYDYILKNAEQQYFLGYIKTLNSNMLNKLLSDYKTITDENIKSQTAAVIGYFAVAAGILGQTPPSGIPADTAAKVSDEMGLIKAAETSTSSPLFGVTVNYAQFTPRGHYTSSDDLKKYFGAMMWYGLIQFPLTDSNGNMDKNSTLKAMIMSRELYALDLSDGYGLWEKIYSPTSFFVGNSDDLSPYQYINIIKSVYGGNMALNSFSDMNKLNEFFSEAKKLAAPQISQTGISEFKFMGQRYVADSEILQKLSNATPDGKADRIPMGLDVMAVFGSNRAQSLIKTYDDPSTRWPDHTKNFNDLKNKFDNLSEDTWKSNMYYSWLWTLKSQTDEFGKGYPMFMQTDAWKDKSLSTALGSWTELRHDTVLYAKQSVAEKGGDDEEPPEIVNYVEPNVAVYDKLIWMTKFSRENLKARGILDGAVEEQMINFEDLLSFLKNCSEKELKNEVLSKDDNDRIRSYGGALESLIKTCQTATLEEGIVDIAGESMAVTVDVHNQNGTFLQEGVGNAAEIYAVVPVGDKLYLTKGAAFSYYEFMGSSKPLTDEEWKSMIENKTAPENPVWTKSFIVK